MDRLFNWARSPSSSSSKAHNNNNNNNNNNTRHSDIDYESLPLADSSSSSSSSSLFRRRPAWLNPQTKSRTTYWLSLLLPFFIARPLGLTSKTLPKVGSTSYLNGIRGLACWIVVNFHLSMESYKDYAYPYGCSKETCGPKHAHFIQLPVLRILISGTGMVSVFFVLSGFVLSFSSLRRMNSPERKENPGKTSDDFLTSLSSSALRRAIRLFLPLLALILVTDIALQIHPSGGINNQGHHEPGFWPTLKFMWDQGVKACFNPYNFHKTSFPRLFEQAWTLGVEYRMSLVVYLVLLFVCKLETGWRKTFFVAAGIYGMYADRRWDAMCFLGGMLIAEMRFAPLTKDLGRLLGRGRGRGEIGREKEVKMNKWVVKGLATVSVLVGVMLVSWPVDFHGRAPYRWFFAFAPKAWASDHKQDQANSTKRYFASLGSILLIWGLEHLEFMQWVLSRSFMIYAGEISYSFYLLQKLTRFYVNEPLREYLREERGWSLDAAFRVDYVVGVFVLVVVSDYFWRMADEPSVKVAQFVVRDCMGVGKKPDEDKNKLPEYNPVPMAERRPPTPPPGPSSSTSRETSLENLLSEEEEEEEDEKNVQFEERERGLVPAIRIE